MGLWLVSRHGEAEQVASNDFDRVLTRVGKIKIIELWQKINDSERDLPTAILASPYVRAQETATLIADVLKITTIETTELLVPEARASLLFDKLTQYQSSQERYLLVSHMPFVGELYSQWCNGIGALAASFRVGEVMAISGEPNIGGGKLLWKCAP